MKKETKEITIDKKSCTYEPKHKPGFDEYKIIFDIENLSFYLIPVSHDHIDHVNQHRLKHFRGATIYIFNSPNKLAININNITSRLGPIPSQYIEEIKKILHKNFYPLSSMQI